MVVTGIMLARAIPGMLAGPLAGVVLDRFDRKRVMIASDLMRAVVALGFILTVNRTETWLLYVLSGLLMVASPFFTSGRAAILPSIATREELHTANSLTQTTQWTTLTIGAFLGGASVTQFGYQWAFVGQCALLSVLGDLHLAAVPAGPRIPAAARALTEAEVVRPWHEYVEGLRYMRAVPLILGIGLIALGWATGGGAAQILFSIFGEMVFNRGPAGIGMIWGCAGIGLLFGGALAYTIGPRLSFANYKRTIVICYIVHGGSYILFSQMRNFAWALVFIALSRAAVGVSSVLNMSQLLRLVPNEFRGRVFSTIESMQWVVMMVSMTLAGIASQYWDPRTIGAIAGALSSTTAIFWGWAHLTRPPAGAGAGRRRAGGDRSSWRAGRLKHGRDALMNRKGKTILVTGAAKRIGRGIALRLAQEGARVAIHYDRSEAEARRTAEECGGAELFRANLESVPEIERMFARGGAAPRTARRPGQQRRALHALRSAGDHREGLGLHPLREPEGRLLLLPAGGAADEAAGRRPDRQHQLAGRHPAVGGARALLRVEGRRDHADARAGARPSRRRSR